MGIRACNSRMILSFWDRIRVRLWISPSCTVVSASRFASHVRALVRSDESWSFIWTRPELFSFATRSSSLSAWMSSSSMLA